MSNNTLRKLISFMISFIMMICMVVGVMGSWLMFEVLNYDAVRVKAGEDFYRLLYDEVCENVLLQTVSTGVPEDLILKPLSRTLIDEVTQNQLEAVLSGNKYTIDLKDMREEYVSLFSAYAAETGEILDFEDAGKLADYCISIVKRSIELPFGSVISSYIAVMHNYLPVVILVCFAFVLSLAVFIYKISKPRINATRYYGIALCGVGVIGLVVSISALATRVYAKINFDSDAYNSAISGLGSYVLKSLTVLSSVIFLIGAVGLIVFSVYGMGGEKDEIA